MVDMESGRKFLALTRFAIADVLAPCCSGQGTDPTVGQRFDDAGPRRVHRDEVGSDHACSERSRAIGGLMILIILGVSARIAIIDQLREMTWTNAHILGTEEQEERRCLEARESDRPQHF